MTPTKINRLIVSVLAGKKTICNCLAITDEVLQITQRGLIHFRRHVSLPILFFPLSADAGQNEVHYRILLRLISSFATPSYIDVMCRHKCGAGCLEPVQCLKEFQRLKISFTEVVFFIGLTDASTALETTP